MAKGSYEGEGRTFNRAARDVSESSSPVQEQSSGSEAKSPKKKRVRDTSFMRGLSASERFQARDGGYEWYMGGEDPTTR